MDKNERKQLAIETIYNQALVNKQEFTLKLHSYLDKDLIDTMALDNVLNNMSMNDLKIKNIQNLFMQKPEENK